MKKDTAGGSIHHLLNVLFSHQMLPDKKIKILEKEFEIRTDHTLGEELNDMCNLGEGIWERGIKTGIKEGLTRGISQGRQTGITEKTKTVIKNMLNRGMSDDDIRALAECEQELIDAVRNSLSQ